MTSFNPGDRVTDGRYIGFVEEVRGDYAVIKDPRRIMRVPIKMKYLRPAWQVCKDCDGTGSGFIAGGCCDEHASAPCPTCKGAGRINRTGPYRLANGTWSDEVDRTLPLSTGRRGAENPDRIRVVCQKNLIGVYRDEAIVMQGRDWFDLKDRTFQEAIAYAHKKAREVAE